MLAHRWLPDWLKMTPGWDSSGRKATKAGPTKRHLSTRDASGRDFLPALQLDFSHCAAYQSASIKCFIRARGLFAGPSPRATRKKSLRQPTTAASARGVGQAPEKASGLRKLARKRHRVHFRALQPSTNRARHAPRSPHFERMGKERIYPFLCQMAKVEL